MTTVRKRIFTKQNPRIGNTFLKSTVAYWEWNRGRGLYVVYVDGTKIKSQYNLRELLSGRPEGSIIEIVGK